MCGIAGKVSARASCSRELMERMCEAMVHRGPDSRGIHCGDGAALGIQRLRVIDLETGDQPIYNEDRTVAVVLNGEIYNYRELRRDLSRHGHEFATNGDTEVIAHLYEERGPDCVRDLQGMFGLAVWDSRRRRLLIARDRVGKKPLYYSHGSGALSFASELPALMQDAEIPREISPEAVDCYLAYGYVPAPLSIWRNARKLEPATTLVYEPDSERATLQPYWSLDYSNKLNGSSQELEEELRRRVAAAVRRRMIADVPLGAFLSGGVDSSVVVSEMAAAAAEPVKTFSIGFDVESYNELPRARLIADRFATDHHELTVKPDAVELIPRVVRHYGEPYADPSAIPSFYVAEFARRHVTVALNGDGGDENFGGYRRYVANAATARIDQLPRGIRRAIAATGRALPRTSGAKTVFAYGRRTLMPFDQEPAERYRRHMSLFNTDERMRLYEPAFAADVHTGVADAVIERPWREATGSSRLDVILEVDIATYLPGDLLTKMDIATMAYSLEARSPLLDPEVMEFAAALPSSTKIHRLRKKWILREAYRDRIPAAILGGRKQGFNLPIAEWFRGDLRDYVREVLLDRNTLDRGYFRRENVVEILSAHEAGRGDRSLQIWSLLMFELWHRAFADAG